MISTGSPAKNQVRPAHVASLRVLLVAENISLRQSGETSIPYYYFDRLLRRKIEVHAICHARVRDELQRELSPECFERITFIEDSSLQRAVFALGKLFPYRIEDLVFGQIIQLLTQLRMRGLAKQLVQVHGITLVFQPVPISPRSPSFMFGLGAPVVIGPMCGGLELPAAFAAMDGRLVAWSIGRSRALANLMHRLVPGKCQAAALIVGNRRTAAALPHRTRGRVYEVVESGVDLERWAPKPYPVVQAGAKVRFVFCGRLVDWKGASLLVEAFVPLAKSGRAVLDLIGDGELRAELERQIAAAGIGEAVRVHGRLPLARCIELMTAADVYAMPSLRECGGLALLEAMAIGLPIVATNWMGPAEYLTPACAILVDPVSKDAMVAGFTEAMSRLADSPPLRQALGQAARTRVFGGHFGWESKVARVVEIMSEVLEERAGRSSYAVLGVGQA